MSLKDGSKLFKGSGQAQQWTTRRNTLQRKSHSWTWNTTGLDTLLSFITRPLQEIENELLPDSGPHTKHLVECLGRAGSKRTVLQNALLRPHWIECFTEKRGISSVNKAEPHLFVDESKLEWNFTSRRKARTMVKGNPDRKILFQTGFSSVGTRNLANTWRTAKPGLNVGHWDKAKIGHAMIDNLVNGKPILGDYLKRYKVILDPNGYEETEERILHGARFFPEVLAQYPQAYFIVNIRSDPWGWIASKEKHWVDVQNFVKNQWYLQWFFHYAEVFIHFSITYESDHERARALVFDVGSDTGAVLERWTREKLGAEIDSSVYDKWLKLHKNDTFGI